MLIWQAHKGKIESVAFSPDGQLLATATGGTKTPYLWEPTTGKLVRKLDGERGPVQSVGFAPDAPLFAAGAAEALRVWRTDTWEVCAELRIEYALELAFGPGPTPMLAAEFGGRVRVWNDAGAAAAAPRDADGRYENARGTATVHFSPDGALLVTSTTAGAELWRTADRTRVRALRANATNARGAVRFAPDGQRVAIAYGKWVEVWPVADETGPLLKIAAGTGRSPIIWAVTWTADARTLLTAGNDGFVRMWDAGTGAELRSFNWEIGKLYCAAFSPDGLTCAACSAKGQVVVWDVET